MSAGGSTREDRGLRAVSRVRAVRERDSLLGLQQARREQTEREQELAQLEESVRAHGAFVSGDMAAFVALRHSLAALRHSVSAARVAEESARTVSLDAAAHWEIDRTRLEAVDGLLARRAEDRAAEARRVDATELDETAARLWLHRRGEDA